MKRFINKIKKDCRNFVTGKSGFSLVELIVVIAIMAVMAAVLAPALLGYVERSRAQKDTSAMSEVVNSVQLSLADQNVYDEMLMYSAEQYSCYVDSDSPDEANKVDIKTGKYFMYNDNERQLDETVYKLDGVMRGVTITFAPDAAASNSATLDLVKGHVNKYLPSGKKTYGGLTGTNASPQLSAIVDSELYNSLRATIGDKIAISSQTYRNSEYTIFIAMGTTGGNQADMQDAIKVWGQWSGTNLPEGTSVATNGASAGTSAGSNEFQGSTEISDIENLTHNGIIPTGGTYRVDATGEILQAGDNFPSNVKYGDIYTYGDYQYCCTTLTTTEWRVSLNTDIPYITNKSSYGAILEYINNAPVTELNDLFAWCADMTTAPNIPKTAKNIDGMFAICYALKVAPEIPDGVVSMCHTFNECTQLTSAPLIIPKTVTSMYETFLSCDNLYGIIKIPCHIEDFEVDETWWGSHLTVERYHYDGCGH